MDIFRIFRKKKTSDISKEPVKTEPVRKIIRQGFNCQFCDFTSELDASKVYPVRVRLLYKDDFVIGKGYKCPSCHNENIIG